MESFKSFRAIFVLPARSQARMEAKYKLFFKVAKKNAKTMRNLATKLGLDSLKYAYILN